MLLTGGKRLRGGRTGQAGAALAVAHVGLDAADEQRVARRVPCARAVQSVYGGQFLAVAHHRACPMRLYVCHVLRRHAAGRAHLGTQAKVQRQGCSGPDNTLLHTVGLRMHHDLA